MPGIREATSEITTDMGAWQGLTVPNGTPVDIGNRLRGGLHTAMADAALREHLTGQGFVMLGCAQKQYLDCMKAEGEWWANVVPETDVKAQ